MKKNKLLIALGLLAGLPMTNAAVVNNYSYDALGRLTSVSNARDVATEAYAYDGVGNIVEKTIDGKTYRLSYDAAHQLQSAEGPDGRHEFVYDKAGRLVKEVLNGEPTARYTYGYLDKVIAVERNGEVTRFDYDAQGMLVGKQLPDGSYEHWTWDGMALVARGEERYINESHITGGLPLVSETEEGVRYHQHDHLGTTVASYTVDGEVAATYVATVYGQGELENSPSARFTGKPYDADLGAYVFPFRNYDPAAARWLSADPSGFPDGPNNHFYAAVPTMGVDPLGLAIVFGNNVSQTTQDVFANVSSSDYGQNPDSSFAQVSESSQGILVTEGNTNNYNRETNTLTINPDGDVMITVDADGIPNTGLASLESIIIHETQHAFDDFFNSDSYSDFRDTPGTMGNSVLEDRAMNEANRYRLLVDEDLRIWYNDLNDFLEQ